jgi:Ca2+-binding RTX toxin-like protein
VLGRGGNDRISAGGEPAFQAPLDTKIAVSAGKGRDRVIGSALSDLIGGGSDSDFVKGGKGRDRIRTQAGSDTLRVRDHERDHVSCGPGDDKIHADRIDRLGGCDLH